MVEVLEDVAVVSPVANFGSDVVADAALEVVALNTKDMGPVVLGVFADAARVLNALPNVAVEAADF